MLPDKIRKDETKRSFCKDLFCDMGSFFQVSDNFEHPVICPSIQDIAFGVLYSCPLPQLFVPPSSLYLKQSTGQHN